MDDLVIRAWTAVFMVASVMTGSTSDFRLFGLASEGKILSFTEKIHISIMPSQKAGMESPRRERIETTMSDSEYWCVAEMMPAGIDNITERMSARRDSKAVFGKRSRIVLNTGLFET